VTLSVAAVAWSLTVDGTNTSTSCSYVPGTATLEPAADVTIASTPTDDYLAGATAALSGQCDLSEDGDALEGLSYSYDLSGTLITAESDGAGGWSFTGRDTVEHYQAVLRSLTYTDAATTPTIGARTLNLSIDDGNGTGSVATATIEIDLVRL